MGSSSSGQHQRKIQPYRFFDMRFVGARAVHGCDGMKRLENFCDAASPAVTLQVCCRRPISVLAHENHASRFLPDLIGTCLSCTKYRLLSRWSGRKLLQSAEGQEF